VKIENPKCVLAAGSLESGTPRFRLPAGRTRFREEGRKRRTRRPEVMVPLSKKKKKKKVGDVSEELCNGKHGLQAEEFGELRATYEIVQS
jgi:hypothetical protein